MPLVSVIMPVKNGEMYITESLISLSNQTFRDFELIVVDDQSTDSTLEMVEKLQIPNIKIIQTNGEGGLVAALNLGLEISEGSLIARLDADDISLDKRLSLQVDRFDKNPSLGLCGSQGLTFGSFQRKLRYPQTNSHIKARLLFSNPFAHSAVMFRKEALPNRVEKYNSAYPVAEDYELWSVMLRNWEGINLPEQLLRYRVHSGQVSAQKAAIRKQSVYNIYNQLLKNPNTNISENELLLHFEISNNPFYLGEHPSMYPSIKAWLQKLCTIDFSQLRLDVQTIKSETKQQLKRQLIYAPLTPVKRIKDKASYSNG